MLMLLACLVNPISDEPTAVVLPTDRTGPPVVVDVVRGPEWTRRSGIYVVQFSSLPNLAVWVESRTDDGGWAFVDTLYVTGADYAALRHAGKDTGEQWWRQSLPVWSGRVLQAGQRLPSKDAPWPDGVTGATPESTFELRTRLPETTGALRLRLEVNTSGDYNEAYPKGESDWVGQPSVVYEVVVPGPAGRHTLSPVGVGVGVASGAIDADLSELDTALRILDEVVVTFPDQSPG